MAIRVDDVVIGAGQAGPSLAVKLARSGRTVAVVERKWLGGTCVNDGCTPTKTLVASARVAYQAREASRWGVTLGGPVTVDMAKVKARKDEVVLESRDGLEQWLGGTDGLKVLRGTARFTSPRSLDVDGDRVEAERFFINVGARASMPDTPGLAEVALTNTGMMDLDHLPRHLAIIGGGVVAVEFAQVYRRFGSEVTVLQRNPRLLPGEDEDVTDIITGVLRREGVDVRTGSSVARVERTGGGARLHLEGGGTVEASHVLVATGRVPNSDTLDLAAAGVEVDRKGYIVVDDTLRTAAPHIWALGDVNGKGAFTHTSYNDHQIVAANLLDGGHRSVADRVYVAATYVDPPLGRVGMTEREARASGKRVLRGVRPMSRVSRAREKGETDGLMKVLVDADDTRLLGAAILGVEGDEVVHTIAAVMNARAPYTALQQAVFAHPTVAELVPTVLGELEPL